MSILSLTLISFGLSIDSLAASITTGASIDKIKKRYVLKVALFMAFFQGTMPLLGWLLGVNSKQFIEAYDHWVAFSLLLVIGGKLIYDGITDNSDDENEQLKTPTSNLILAGMALATSIDAMVIGIGFGVISVNIWLAIGIIGLTTFVFSSAGVYVGKKMGNRINSSIEVLGGGVLIALGTKILIEHLYF